MKFIVIGLGNFGAALAINLTSLGHEVIAVDMDFHKVDYFKDKVYSTVCIDPKDMHALATLPLKDTDVVIVAIGEDFGASVMITAQLKQMKVKKIIGRSINELHRTVLEAIGVDEIVRPEQETADRFSKKLELKGYIDSFEIAEGYNIVELIVPEMFIGMSVRESAFRKRFNIMIVTIMRESEYKTVFGTSKMKRQALGVITPETVFEKNDILVLYGNNDDIKKMSEITS
ncbi:MAG: potassium transporter TrkA [Bacteroidetes bacterium GWE2_29_8]|nr:MAG: potassium transporter TrkA [Bacteroidetes bacterium GWE2_29_8]OFY21708.1 MAG: potassium transporter TrkA [Bacteroidetes bacterium GWF2_29_10]